MRCPSGGYLLQSFEHISQLLKLQLRLTSTSRIASLKPTDLVAQTFFQCHQISYFLAHVVDLSVELQQKLSRLSGSLALSLALPVSFSLCRPLFVCFSPCLPLSLPPSCSPLLTPFLPLSLPLSPSSRTCSCAWDGTSSIMPLDLSPSRSDRFWKSLYRLFASSNSSCTNTAQPEARHVRAAQLSWREGMCV